MKLIDIDRLKLIENHIHYIKEYEGSCVLMDKMAKILRSDIKFSIEYKPVGMPDVKVNFLNKMSFPLESILVKVKEKIQKMDQDGTLSSLHKK